MLKYLLVVLVAIGCHTANAEVLEINRAGPTCDPNFRACTFVVKIDGDITDTTVNQLNSLIGKAEKEAEASQSIFSLVVELNSAGGSVNAAMAIGRIARNKEAGTFVNRGNICFSACVFILAGGSYRAFDGSVGIHRPYFQVPSGEVSNENIKTSYQRMLQELRAYLREMNVAEGLADAMLRISPENMRLLGPDQLAHYGLTEVDPIASETFDLKRAKSLGLDRREYMRRKTVAEAQCGGPASFGTRCYRSILKYGSKEQPDLSQFGRPAQ